MTKKIIFNSDGFGLSKASNRGVLDAYKFGILKSASIVANGLEFKDAIENIVPQCSDLNIGIHLNVTTGKSICNDLTNLTDSDNNFNNTYAQLLLKSYNPKETDFFAQLEREFRRQIETILSKTTVTHIDSYSQIHSIPKIFELVCKLAKEYEIPTIITHTEKFYVIPEIKKYLTTQFLTNILKNRILYLFSFINKKNLSKYNLQTNNYLIGTLYDSLMNSLVVSYGINANNFNDTIIEVRIHPCRYNDGTIDKYFDELMLIKNNKLKNKLIDMGYEITNYVKKEL